MTNAELIDKLRILQVAILNPHHRDGEYVDKRFADVCVAAADAIERLMDEVDRKDKALQAWAKTWEQTKGKLIDHICENREYAYQVAKAERGDAE